MAIEIKSSLLNEEELKFVKNSIILVSEKDNKDKFRVRTIEYINDSSAAEDDEFFFDMLEFVRFLDPEKAGKHIAYTTPDCMIFLNCPCKQIGETVRYWEFVYDHECMHQLWETFKVEDKIKNLHGTCDHELLNIASDCVINDYLAFWRKKAMPPVGITPEKIKEKFGVEFDRQGDTQYTLYLKLKKVVDENRQLLKNLMNDPDFQDAMQGEGAPQQGSQGQGQGQGQGQSGSGGSSDEDIDKMSGEEAAKDAQKSADEAKEAAKEAQKNADKAAQQAKDSGKLKDSKVAKDAQQDADDAKEAAKAAQEAADKAKEAAGNGDDDTARDKAKEARDKANEAKSKANKGQSSGDGDGQEGSEGEGEGSEGEGEAQEGEQGKDGKGGGKGAGKGSGNYGPAGETPEDLEKIRKKFKNKIDKYAHIMSGMIGDFTKRCRKSFECSKDGIRVSSTERTGNNGWDKSLALSVNNFVKKKVFQKKKEWERTYRKPKRGSGFIEYGQPIKPGKRTKKQAFVISVAFYLDRSGSMQYSLQNCFEAAYTIADALKKKYSKEKVVDDVVFKMYTFDDVFDEIKWGNKVSDRGGTMPFHKLLEGILARTNDYLVNIIITDAQFPKVQPTEVTKFLEQINGMVNFITNTENSTIKEIASKNQTKLYYLLADHNFILDKDL